LKWLPFDDERAWYRQVSCGGAVIGEEASAPLIADSIPQLRPRADGKLARVEARRR
jgi:hypothetical protein